MKISTEEYDVANQLVHSCSCVAWYFHILSWFSMIQYSNLCMCIPCRHGDLLDSDSWFLPNDLRPPFSVIMFIYFASIYTHIMIYANLCRFETHNWNHFRFISCYCYSKKHPLKHPNPFQVAIFIKRFENLFEGFQLIFNVLLHEVDEFTFLQVRKSSVLRRPRVVPFLHQCGCHSDEE